MATNSPFARPTKAPPAKPPVKSLADMVGKPKALTPKALTPKAPAPKAPAPKAPAPKLPPKPVLGDLPAAKLPQMGNRFVMVKLGMAIPSNARQSRKIVERNAANGGAETCAAKAAIVLFDPKHLDELRNIRSNVVSKLNDIGLKTSDGHWIVHAAQSKSLIELGTAAEQAYKESAAEFIANYEDYCRQWSGRLGDDYDPKLYPDIEKIAAQMGVVTAGNTSTGSAPKRKRGFSFSMRMIQEHDDGLESSLGLSLTDSEREFIAQGARDHYQAVIDDAYSQLQDAVAKIAEGSQDGRRIKQATVANARAIAGKIEAMGLDQHGIAARVHQLADEGVPDKRQKPEARQQYSARARAVLDDLASLNDQGD